jgi:hypothetical protein
MKPAPYLSEKRAAVFIWIGAAVFTLGAMIFGHWRCSMTNTRKIYYRNSLDLRDKVQVKVLRRRLKLSDGQLTTVIRKSGPSISAITKEAATLRWAKLSAVDQAARAIAGVAHFYL